jgi:hypothetical protein
MKAMKFRVYSEDHSKAIQTALFKEGYAWVKTDKTFRHTDAEYLVAAGFGPDDNCITYVSNDKVFFDEFRADEYILTPQGTFARVEDYFKQPETTYAPLPTDPEPIGLVPKSIHDSNRLRDIVEAMQRFASADKRIPAEWISELQYLNNLVE